MNDPKKFLAPSDEPVCCTQSGDRWLKVGQIAGPFGVQGAMKIYSGMSDPVDLGQWDTWWLGGADRDKVAHEVLWCKPHGKGLIASLRDVTDRDRAAAMAGFAIWIPRERLPECERDHYYWADLVGMVVMDRAGRSLGRVAHLFETGAQDVMTIVDEAGHEVLIPFVAAFVDAVDNEERIITVNPLPGMV
ncbi:MAG: 16S rRNA processing protein RimM [Magnetococcales bacterium]|nr:16S rRNA processing protein RimM [Magnetococcales bacterium]